MQLTKSISSQPQEQAAQVSRNTNNTHNPQEQHNHNGDDGTEINQFEWTSSQCLVFVTPILLFIIIVLLISSNTVQPQATYVAYGLIVISVLAILTAITFRSLKEDAAEDRLIDGEERAPDPSPVYTIDNHSIPVIDSSGISMCLPEFPLPPKYEFPPSYAQAISS